jgi:hypothetical protein
MSGQSDVVQHVDGFLVDHSLLLLIAKFWRGLKPASEFETLLQTVLS